MIAVEGRQASTNCLVLRLIQLRWQPLICYVIPQSISLWRTVLTAFLNLLPSIHPLVAVKINSQNMFYLEIASLHNNKLENIIQKFVNN